MPMTEMKALRGVTEPGWDELLPRILAPRMPHADATIAKTKGMSTAFAYKALGFWRRAWTTAEERSFLDQVAPTEGSSEPSLRLTWGVRRLVPSPPTLEGVNTVYADLEGFALAEVLAAEVFRRLVPLGLRVPTRVVWLIEPQPRILTVRDAQPFRQRLDVALRLDEARLAQGEVVVNVPRPVPDAWRLDWHHLAKRDLVRANAWRARGEWRAQDGSPMPSPLDPLIDLWRIGYALASASDDTMLLVAESVTDA